MSVRARPLLTLAALLAASTGASGCVGAETVRAVLLEETYTLSEDAPAAARERVASPMRGCVPGLYDPDTRTLRLLPRESTRPDFALVVARGEELVAMTAGSSAGPLDVPALRERGTSGAWGFAPPFSVAAEELELAWGPKGATLDGTPLREGEPVVASREHEIRWENATFRLEHRVQATYLGRVAYEETLTCDDA